MSTADLILEYLVTGAVGLILVASVLFMLGVPVSSATQLLEDGPLKIAAGVLALPAVYYLGIGVHHSSWLIWRRAFHRRLFTRIFKAEPPPHRSYQDMRDLASAACAAARSPLGNQDSWESKIEWCRFAILQQNSGDSLREYSKQYHLYRATYGPQLQRTARSNQPW